MKQKFFKCSNCGKIVALVKETGIPVFCCGMAMVQMTAGTTDASAEKHVPVVKREGNILTVEVGEVVHPMEQGHHIEWISVQTNLGNQRKAVKDQPKAIFALLDGEEVEAVYAHCNLHGLWKA